MCYIDRISSSLFAAVQANVLARSIPLSTCSSAHCRTEFRFYQTSKSQRSPICFYLFFVQLINYERALYGYTSVSFVNTSFGSVPDIYLSMPTTRARRQTSTAHIPIQAVNSTLGKRALSPPPQRSTVTMNLSPARSSFLYSSSPALTLPRQQNSLANRSTTSALPTRATTTISTYGNAYNSGASTKNARPVSSSFAYQNPHPTVVSNGTVNKSILRQPTAVARLNSTPLARPTELTREFFAPTKVDSFRTVKYVPSSYNRYHLP